ncbi:MAG: hypothetical protein ACFFDN_43545 [Candidatus Hodarchaeota archaeon]
MNFKQDLDRIIHLSKYFDKDLTSLKPTRKKQNSKFVDQIREKALKKMGDWPRLPDKRLFYVGSVDFMVTEYNDQRKFVILETNGGSTRGLFATTFDQIEMIFNAFKSAIDNINGVNQKRVLIGTLPKDDLYQEKIMLGEYLRDRYEKEGIRIGIYNIFNYNTPQKKNEDIILIYSNYKNLFEFLDYKNKYFMFLNDKINVIIGDGVVRRFPNKSFQKENWRNIKTKIINPIYPVTDDKASTYVAIYMGYDTLEKYRIQPLQFARVFSKNQLEELMKLINNMNKNFVLKPFGGSGGAGIKPFVKNTSIQQIPKIIEDSISEFHQKFNTSRDPFPYTIQEMAQFKLINWKNSKRTFDLRINVIQEDGNIVPVGGSIRIAKAAHTGKFTKDEFVVNICGDWGVDFERAWGISPEILKILDLTDEDLIDIFCATCQIFSVICNKYEEIISFNQWDKYLQINNTN